MKDNSGKAKGFGFVCFKLPESATKALELHNQEVHGSKLYVVRA